MTLVGGFPVALLHATSALPGDDVPGAPLANAELSELMQQARDDGDLNGEVPICSPEFPEERLGIRSRRILSASSSLRQMAQAAAAKLFDECSFNRERVRLIIATSVSRASVVPALSVCLQHDLRLASSVIAFDLVLGCSGFVAALDLACRTLATLQPGEIALVVSAEAMHRVLDVADRTTLPVFGDGAACVALERVESPHVLPVDWHTAGDAGENITIRPHDKGAPLLRLAHAEEGFELRFDRAGSLRVSMEGRRVFRDMLRLLPAHLRAFAQRHRIAWSDIDHFIFHQANQRMIDAVAAELELPPDRVASNIAELGNTTSASIPILIAQLARAGRIRQGQRILIAGFGTGYSAGVTVLEWCAP